MCFNTSVSFLYRAELEKHGYKMETSQFLQNMEWFNTELWIDFIEKRRKDGK